MAAPRLQEQFAVFNLLQSANLDQVDRQYFTLTNHLLRVKLTDPLRAIQEQKRLDDNYAVLLRYFIYTQPPSREPDLTYDDLKKQKDLVSTMRSRPQSPDIVDMWDDIGDYHIKRSIGDIFEDAPDQAVIIHATNCLGVWGAGFAAELKDRYPAAFGVYQKFCSRRTKRNALLVGTCLLIDPQPEDQTTAADQPKRPSQYVACLFTSRGYGRAYGDNPGRGSVEEILQNTESALLDLIDKLEQRDLSDQAPEQKPGHLCSNEFNSGLFGVPWKSTQEVIERLLQGYNRPWTVYILPERMRDRARARVDATADERSQTPHVDD